MGEQAKFLEVLDRFAEIGEGVELAEDLLAQGAKARDGVAQFRVLVPLVGAFNAGKTTLVNAYLQRQHGKGLPTDIVPQTALATEIYAAPSAEAERVELIGEDDAVLREVGLEEFGEVEKQTLKTGDLEAQYAKAHLHHAALPDSNRKVLVDMPGLDSGLRTHNAAIQRYLPLGGYFFMVVDAEHGTLRQSEIEQLREFLAQEVDFTVLVNKIDKKPQADADAIVSHIQEQVRQAFDKPAPVCPVSAASDDVAAFRDALAAVDYDDSLRRYWRLPTLRLLDGAINSLNTCYSAFNVSTAESERVIEDLERKEEAIKDKLSQDERDIKNRYAAPAVDRIVRAVRDAIAESATSLADTYLQDGKDAGDREVNELVRHTLNHVVAEEQDDTKSRLVERYRADIDEINADWENFTGRGEQANTSPTIDASLLNVADDMRRAADLIQHPQARVILETLATALEVIGSVASLFRRLFGPSSTERAQREHERQRQDLSVHISTRVAPRVASEVRPRIESGYNEIAKRMLLNLRQQVGVEVGRICADIRKSQAEMAAKTEDLQASKDALRTAINDLFELKAPLERQL